jgi:hypothetical protein
MKELGELIGIIFEIVWMTLKGLFSFFELLVKMFVSMAGVILTLSTSCCLAIPLTIGFFIVLGLL